MIDLEQIHWELSVLTRAVPYQNLSGASSHVGISQPQLSRIIAKIESTLGVALLDREARRKSSWTPYAHKLAETYSENARQLSSQIQKLNDSSQLDHLKIGTLEGLIPLATRFCKKVFEQTEVKTLEFLVEDLNELEERFFKRNLDLIFSFREPGKKKFKYSRLLGYQTLELVPSNSNLEVLSAFEFEMRSKKKTKTNNPILISNSLQVREHWIRQVGGSGVLPSEVKSDRPPSKDRVPVLLVGLDDLPPRFWEKVSKI